MEQHFAAMRIPDSDSDYKLTRAGKTSEVIRTAADGHIKSLATTIPCFNDFKIPSSNRQPWSKSSVIQPAKFAHNKIEYMEVDEIDSPKDSSFLKNHAHPGFPKSFSDCIEPSDKASTEDDTTKMKDSINSVPKPNYNAMKKRIRPLIPMEAKKSRTRECSSFIIFFFILLPIIILPLGIFITNEVSLQNPCNHHTNFRNLSNELEEKVYGHSDAIRKLVDYLERNDSCSKIVALIGGTGVGKSYTAEILRRNFSNKNNIFVYFPPLKINAKTTVLSSLFCNLVILENLGENDLTDFINYAKASQVKENYCVIIFGLFNMDYVDINLARKSALKEHVRIIENSLQKENVPAATIVYKPLSENVLEKCIIDAAMKSDLNLTKEQISQVKQNLISFNSGCKGAYSKVQLFGRE